MAKRIHLTPRRATIWITAFFAGFLFLTTVGSSVIMSAVTGTADIAYTKAVLTAYTNDVGLHGLTPTALHDPGFTTTGLLTSTDRAARCAQAVASLSAFKLRWLDASTYQGHRIQTHFLPALLVSNVEAAAARNSCISTASFNTFLARIQTIKTHDLVGIHSLSDLAARLPILGHNGVWPAFYSLHGFQAYAWHTLLSDQRLRVLKCEADPHCNVFHMLKRAYEAQKGSGAHDA